MSEQPKWTPGPLRLHEVRGNRPRIIIRDVTGVAVAEMYNRMEWQRYARLLAASSEMYETLELFERHMQGAQMPTLETNLKMNAALAKARGDA